MRCTAIETSIKCYLMIHMLDGWHGVIACSLLDTTVMTLHWHIKAKQFFNFNQTLSNFSNESNMSPVGHHLCWISNVTNKWFNINDMTLALGNILLLVSENKDLIITTIFHYATKASFPFFYTLILNLQESNDFPSIVQI